MIQEVKYNGYSASPSDYECTDGDLAGAVGLVPDAGAMKPILPPTTLFTLSEGQRVVFIHETSAFKHYIIADEMTNSATIRWMNEGESETTLLSWVQGFVSVQALGNTLMIICEDKVLYFLWKDGAYNNLGDHIPDVNISFGLVGHPRLFSVSDESKKKISISFDAISTDNLFNDFTEANATKITDAIMGKVNKFVKQQTIDKGRFCFPFFVRYALRLFDGSLVSHSAPILMNPSTTMCPMVFWTDFTGKNSSYSSANIDIMLVAADLDYSILSPEGHKLEYWSDIVKSIDVFISKPLYQYDQSGKCKKFGGQDDIVSSFIGRLACEGLYTSGQTKEDLVIPPFKADSVVDLFKDMYADWQYRYIYSMYFADDRKYPISFLQLPEFETKEVKETLADTSTFFKLFSIDVEDIKVDERKKVEIPENYLSSLLTREVMTDDYLTHDQLVPSHTMVYNQRVNLVGVKRKPFNGFPIRSMLAFQNYLYDWTTDDGKTIIIDKLIPQRKFSVEVLIKENGGNYRVTMSDENLPPLLPPLLSSIGQTRWEPYINLTEGYKHIQIKERSWGCYFFYPNANAYKMRITDSISKQSLDIELKSHAFLNGAYGLLDYNSIRNASNSVWLVQQANLIPVPNKIYTSEVNNPFYFPLLGINTIGTGNILGISTAAKALSEGQFGQFPLYAFTTDGVWALEVSATGSYSARQPITRDVCISADSITQIDSAVLFATDRGIMLLSGSESQCISDILDSKEAFSIFDLPWCEQLINKSGLSQSDFEILPFREFLADCRMLYDYNHQHIIVYNPNCTYAYVYSLESKAWGMTHSDIASGVNSYPEALAMTHTGELIDFSKSNVTQGLKGVLVTRPIKLGSADIHKTIDTVIQRGHFHKGHIQVALYGSRNLYDWFLVSSSTDHYLRGFRGTPYKYFRIVLLCNLDHDESVYGCTVQFTPKLLNQPR